LPGKRALGADSVYALLDQLIAVLENQTGHHRLLLNTLSKEREAIVDSRLDLIKQTCEDKRDILRHISDSERQMMALMDQLAKLLGIKSENLSMMRIAERATEPYRTRLFKCGSNIKALIASIGEANSVNKYLLNHCLEIVKGSLDLLNSISASDTVYHANGRIGKFRPGGRLVEGNF
jgi:flagellar biosynthesis/type III secretory pathway chaperone